jgi:hypothetical protein
MNNGPWGDIKMRVGPRSRLHLRLGLGLGFLIVLRIGIDLVSVSVRDKLWVRYQGPAIALSVPLQL